MPDAPILQTNRLVLSKPTFRDWPDYAAVMATERAIFMGGPFDQRQAWGLFCHDVAQWSLFGLGALMIRLRDGGRCVGQVGLNAGPLCPEHELGWMLYPGTEGNGYALEAATVLRRWAFAEHELPTLVSYIDADNARSRALAERLGAHLDPGAARVDPNDLVYRHPAPGGATKTAEQAVEARAGGHETE